MGLTLLGATAILLLVLAQTPVVKRNPQDPRFAPTQAQINAVLQRHELPPSQSQTIDAQ